MSDRFHIQPLLRAVTFPHSAFILVLGENGVKLYQLDADSEPAPRCVFRICQGRQRRAGQDHAERPVTLGPIHGSEGQNFRLRQYARIVDQALRHVLTGRDRP